MTPRHRVLLITAAFPGRVDPGRAVFISHLARALGTSMDVTVLAPRIHRRDPARERREGIEVRRFPFLSEGRLLKEYRRFPAPAASTYLISGIGDALSIAMRRRPDVIYTHWVLPTGPIGLVASRLAGVPLVLNAHGSDINVYAGKGPVLRRLAAETLSGAAFTIASSRPIRDRCVADLGVPPDRIEVIPAGIDAAFLGGPSRAEARRAIGVPASARMILYVGDLTREKGIPVAVRALREIRRAGDPVLACLVGRGPEGMRLAGEEGLLLPGLIPNRDLPAYYRAADLFILPSLSEGMPVSVMEALASGLPVVASRVGGVPDLVRDGETGLLVPPGDAGALAAAVRSLLDDDAGRDRMSRAAVEEGRGHLCTPRAERVADLLRRAIRGPEEASGRLYDRFWRTTRADRRDARSRERARAAGRLLGASANGAKGRGTLLDVGCGRGVAASYMKGRGYDVRGIDVSAEAVRATRSLGIPARISDIERESPRGRFDVILCLEVLEHLRDPAAALRRMAAALRPGGRLIVSLPGSPPIIRLALREARGHLHRFSREAAIRRFGKAGLAVVGEEVVSVAPPRWGPIKRAIDSAASLAPSALAISRVYALSSADDR